MRAKQYPAVLIAAILTGTLPQLPAVVVVVDYTYDNGGFFSNATARAAIEKAAFDINSALTPGLGAITQTIVSGTSGSTTVSFQYSYVIQNPTTGTNQTITNTLLPEDTVRVYVGARALDGGTLGIGGPAGTSLGMGFDGYESEFIAAMDAAEANANAMYGRGGGPVIGSINSSATVGSTSASFSLQLGNTVGSLAFDNDSPWHLDADTPVAGDKFDLYSVGLHEMLHVLGIGTSLSWSNNVSGNDWLGLSVRDLVGSGLDNNLVGVDHITEGTMSTTVVGGTPQEVAMDPNIAAGQRKHLTTLDVAFLQDIGWQSVPEPMTGFFFVIAGSIGILGRKRDALTRLAV
jgi:hypothetical protein